MSVKKTSERQAIPIEPIDPAVENILGKPDDFYSRLARTRKMTPYQRKKAEKDRKRNKETYDLPEWIVQAVDIVASEYRVPKSHVVAHLIAEGLKSFMTNDISLAWSIKPSRSPRYESFLAPPPELNLDELKAILNREK